MATSKDFILEQLDLLDNINCKAMMGEYLLYYNNILFGGIYDNKLLVKIVNSNKKYSMQEYAHALNIILTAKYTIATIIAITQFIIFFLSI